MMMFTYIVLKETVNDPESRRTRALKGDVLPIEEFNALCDEMGCEPDNRAFRAYGLLEACETVNRRGW